MEICFWDRSRLRKEAGMASTAIHYINRRFQQIKIELEINS